MSLKRMIFLILGLALFSAEAFGDPVSSNVQVPLPEISLKQVQKRIQKTSSREPTFSRPKVSKTIKKPVSQAAPSYQISGFEIRRLHQPLHFEAGSTVHFKDGSAYLERNGDVWKIKLIHGDVQYVPVSRGVIDDLTTRIGFSGNGTVDIKNGTISILSDGDLILEGRFDVRASGGSGKLQIHAAGNIEFKGEITTSKRLNLSMDSDQGAILLNGDIRTNGGNFSSKGQNFYAYSDVAPFEINTGSGNMTIRQRQNILIESRILSSGSVVLEAPMVDRVNR